MCLASGQAESDESDSSSAGLEGQKEAALLQGKYQGQEVFLVLVGKRLFYLKQNVLDYIILVYSEEKSLLSFSFFLFYLVLAFSLYIPTIVPHNQSSER